MSFSRAFRRLVARTMAGLVLFTQLAIASYACPGLNAADSAAMPMHSMQASTAQEHAGAPTAVAAAVMSTCEQMAGSHDTASPNLCAEHCHNDQQSSQAHAPEVPAAALFSLYAVAPANPAFPSLSPSAVATTADARIAVSPPHAILHCVFRI